MPDVNRRDFLKLTALTGSAVVAEKAFPHLAEAMELLQGGEQVSRTTGRKRKAVRSTCANCYARCGIIGYVEDGVLMKIGGNPDHPNSRGRLCAKGQAGLNVEYDAERVLFPMKRSGARGSGDWRRISWEEALRAIASRLRRLRAEGRPEQFLYHSDRDITTADFARRFAHAFGTPNCLTPPSLVNSNKMLAHRVTWGVDFDINDVAYTEYILIFGSNPFEAHLLRTSFAQRIAEGRMERFFGGRAHSRAKLVVFDVRCSNTAGRSDEWHPIVPGTDGLVALAMANVIMQENLYDRGFLDQWTNFPVDKLKDHLSQFTPEYAERESSVPADDIRHIAREFASTKPATTISTGGATKHANGVYNERCIMLLDIITGNVDTKGGWCQPRTYTLPQPQPVPPVPQIHSELMEPHDLPLVHHGAPDRLAALIRNGRLKVDTYMTYQSNPAYASPDCGALSQLLKDDKLIPMFVAIDSVMSETASLADIVLPAATYLERWEVDSPPAFQMVPFVSLRQPVVVPLGQARSFMDILLNLAKRVSPEVAKYFAFERAQDYWAQTLLRIPELLAAGGIGLLENRGFWQSALGRADYGRFAAHGFSTPSGKIEVYSTRLAKAGFKPLPTYKPIQSHQRRAPKQLYLTTFQWNVHTHFCTANCMWLSEIVHANPLWINSGTARRLGIAQGDRIRITSKAGSMETQAWVTEGIHPEVVALSDNCGHWASGRVAQAKAFRSKDPETRLIWWGEEGNGDHPNPVIEVALDPVGGGQAWMDTLVEVVKV